VESGGCGADALRSETAMRTAIARAHSATRARHAGALSEVFGTFYQTSPSASSSHFDDAMIRNPRRRMTVAQLKERMDARFNAVDRRFNAIDKRFEAVDQRFDQLAVRMDVGFRSMHDKLNVILLALRHDYDR